MTADQNRVLEMFRALSLAERETLLPELAEATVEDFELSVEDIAAIEEGIAQAERGEVVDGEEALARIAARHNFSRA